MTWRCKKQLTNTRNKLLREGYVQCEERSSPERDLDYWIDVREGGPAIRFYYTARYARVFGLPGVYRRTQDAIDHDNTHHMERHRDLGNAIEKARSARLPNARYF